ncbi:hypothetical protein BH23ACT9_BH23ACT9_23450 [soil metagenome]
MGMLRTCTVFVAAVLLSACGSTGIGVGGELVAADADCLLLAELGTSDGWPFTVPDGFEIRFDPPAILNATGEIVAAEGGVIEGDGQAGQRDSAGTSCDRGDVTVIDIESIAAVTPRDPADEQPTAGRSPAWASPGSASMASEWSCEAPDHGDYFLEELFATPEEALRSVATGNPDDYIVQRRVEDVFEYALLGPGDVLDQLVEVLREDDQWGVLAVTSCIGYGPGSQ